MSWAKGCGVTGRGSAGGVVPGGPLLEDLHGQTGAVPLSESMPFMACLMTRRTATAAVI